MNNIVLIVFCANWDYNKLNLYNFLIQKMFIVTLVQVQLKQAIVCQVL